MQSRRWKKTRKGCGGTLISYPTVTTKTRDATAQKYQFSHIVTPRPPTLPKTEATMKMTVYFWNVLTKNFAKNSISKQ